MNTTYIYLHFPIEAIVKEQVVCHSNAMRFHGMSLSIIVITYVTCIGCIVYENSKLQIIHIESTIHQHFINELLIYFKARCFRQ